MQNLIRFFRMYNVLIIFLLLQTYSINLYLNNNSFQNSLFINHINNYKGELYSISNNISEYFNLKDINKQLLEENNKLYNLLSSQKSDFLQNEKETKFISCKIVNNSVNKRDNFITLNKGKKHGVSAGMGVICESGVLGIVHSTTKNYSLIISILNKESAISISLKRQNNFGSLKWNGFNYKKANIESIPNHVKIQLGDTIITNGYSTIFPAGINIGTIEDFKKNDKTGNQDITINLFTDFNNIKYAYIVNSEQSKEQLNLEDLIND